MDTIPAKVNVLSFKGKNDIPSNFYEHDIYYDGIKFNCVEQAYQHAKAVKCERMDIATRLLHLKTGYEQWRCARAVQVDDRWADERVNIMRKILRCKLRFVPQYRELLSKSTGTIVEAVPGDKFWSSGLNKREACMHDPSTYPGKNVMGQLHMEMRELLKQHARVQADFMTVVDLMDEHSVLEAVMTDQNKEDGTFLTVIGGNDEQLIHDAVRGKLVEKYSVITKDYLVWNCVESREV